VKVRHPLIALALLLLLDVPVRSQKAAQDIEPPATNREEPFSGAVGRKFAVTMTAEPKELRAGDTLRLIIRVTAEGHWNRPPNRPDLRGNKSYARFAQHFHIENAATRHDPDRNAWEFEYLLRPYHEGVTTVPRLPFVYYKPGHGYQTISAPAIKLTVQPRGDVDPTHVQPTVEPTEIPAGLREIVEGPSVLRRDPASFLPHPLLAAIMLAIPPALCGCWYILWRARYPEAARLARQRRSRAARHALRTLDSIRGTTRETTAGQVARITAEYLRERFDLPARDPTPDEVGEHLHEAGVQSDLARDVVVFFKACDAVRFGGSITDESDHLQEKAVKLILDLEVAPCPRTAS
jgi:BatD DUF11 like domain